jgi:hypothetical protein
MSGFEKDIDETNAQVTSRETVKSTILFTNTEAPDKEDPNHALKMESSRHQGLQNGQYGGNLCFSCLSSVWLHDACIL